MMGNRIKTEHAGNTQQVKLHQWKEKQIMFQLQDPLSEPHVDKVACVKGVTR